MPASPKQNQHDNEMKKAYKIIYLKRNFRLKLRDAFAWGLDEADIQLLIKAWKLHAQRMGIDGKRRWNDIERELPSWREAFKRISGMNWVDGKSVSDITRKQTPYSVEQLFPQRKKEMTEPMKVGRGDME